MHLIALGANLDSGLGGPRATLEAALAALGAGGLVVTARSGWFRTPAFPAGSGPDYVNGAAALAKALNSGGGRAEPFKINVAMPAEVEAMVAFAVKTFGGLHGAVNNAGIGGAAAPTAEYGLDDWHRVISVNMHSVFYSMKYEIPAMLTSGGGSIVNMSSILGTNGFASAVAYVSAKHALVGMTKTACLAANCPKSGVTLVPSKRCARPSTPAAIAPRA